MGSIDNKKKYQKEKLQHKNCILSMDYQIVSNNRPLLLELKAENHDHCILKYLVISNKSAYLSQVHRYGSKKHKYLIPHVLL